MAHGIFSEAVTRFNKGQSPLQNNQIIAWAAIQLQSDAAATAGQLIDGKLIPEQVSGRASLYPPIRIAVDFINHRLGLKLTPEAMARLLCNVEFRVDVSSEQLEVSAPFWRTDIELREDIVEEIGRLYGYDKLPISLPRRDIVPAIRNHSLERKNRIRSVLAAAGANEVLTYSFVHGKLLERVSQHPDQAFKLSNALSPDLQYYRFHALPSILDKVHQNIRAGYSAFALFELSKGHSLLHQSDDPDGLPSESEYLDLVYAASSSGSGSALYSARRYLDRLADAFGVSLTYQAMEQSELPTNEPYEVPRSAVVSIAGGPELGIIGELKSSVQAALKLPDYTAAFTISPEVLSEHLPSLTKRYQALSKYPKVEQDICFKVDGLLPYQSLYDVVCSELLAAKPDESHIEVRPLDIYQRDDDQAHRQITFRVSLTSYLQTLRAQDLSVLLDALSVRAGATLQAERV
jgi:phenylalanyl-tRNA synthetase beta chain